MSLLHCYNKGCAGKFDPVDNKEDSCQYHPGAPIFHDALKSWSCCKKKSADFSEFLSIPGCARGPHSNVKPEQPPKPAPSDPSEIVEEIPQKKVRPPNNPNERPSHSEPRIELRKTIGASLKQALEKQMGELSLQSNNKDEINEESVALGTTCKNSGCGQSYTGEASNSEACTYHPGAPVFHEGLKYWSCCQKKTTEFDNFLQQIGCQTGNHVWFKKQTGEKKTCRFDWHQTGNSVNISVYSKLSLPERCHIEANRVSCSVTIVFEGGNSLFERTFILCGVIDPTKSDVKMLGTKVEINMKKAELFQWPDLESKDVPENASCGDSSNTQNSETLDNVGF